MPVAPRTTATRTSASAQLLRLKNRRRLRGFDLERQIVDSHNPDVRSGRYRLRGTCLPEFALDADVAFRFQRLDGLADGTDEVLRSGDDLHAAHAAVEVEDLAAKEA